MMRLLFLATIPVLACLSSAMPPTAFANEPPDPYLWLEEVTGEKPLEWVRERNTESVAALAGTDRFKARPGRRNCQGGSSCPVADHAPPGI